MRFFILFALLVISGEAFAQRGRSAWKVANMKYKVFLLNEYKALLAQHPEKLAEWSLKQTTSLSFISEAFAAEGMDCIYAGWPSQRVGSSCSSPARMNPKYQAGSCQSNELHCQPALFGEGLCAPVSTQVQRNSAFSECEKRFNKAGRTVEDVIRENLGKGLEAELLSLLDFADNICATSKQKNTGMCRRLEAAVLRVRNGLPEVRASIVIQGKEVRDDQVRSDLVGAVSETTVVEGVGQTTGTVPTDCDPSGVPVVRSADKDLPGVVLPFARTEPRPLDFEYTTSRPGSDPSFQNTFTKDKNSEELRPNGFEFRMTGPTSMAGAPIDPAEKVERNWNFVSTDHSQRETYLWVTDDAGSGYLSQLMETIVLLVPRRSRPAVEVVGDELHVTLTTGEKVVYDKKTKLVKSGVLSEGPVDLNPNRFNRKFAPIKYSGTGISIRVDKRGEDPRLIPGNAVITQNGKTCQVPAKELWTPDSDFRYADDKALIDFLNRKCGNKFSI
ncbi:MAG: hypothetical protein ACLGG0_01825 [Bacteriovoracia bacterium]